MKDEKDCACLMCGQVHGDLLEQIAQFRLDIISIKVQRDELWSAS